jgi:hypothetical protein
MMIDEREHREQALYDIIMTNTWVTRLFPFRLIFTIVVILHITHHAN